MTMISLHSPQPHTLGIRLLAAFHYKTAENEAMAKFSAKSPPLSICYADIPLLYKENFITLHSDFTPWALCLKER